MDLHIIYIFLLCIGASFIQRTTGFGFGIFIMTMLPFLLPSYGEATTLSGLLALTTSAAISFRLRKSVSWKRLLPILLTFMAVSAIAVSCLRSMDDSLLRRILGVALVLASLYFIFLSSRIHIRPTLPFQVTAGAISGVLGGFFGMQGPPAVLYFISSEPDNEHYMAIAQMYFFIGNLAMTFFRAGNGFLTPVVGWSYLYGLGGVVIGTVVGSLVYRHIPSNALRYIVYSYIGISGIIVFFTA
ncbi:MAG: sulfite exporter TauE/SafE family protein [Candidatus Cryptobacteroides sp.]